MKLVIHPGLPKTGTTTIQKSLYKAQKLGVLEEFGFCYPNCNFYNHQTSLYAPLLKHVSFNVANANPARFELLKRNLGKIPSGFTTLISAEFISSLPKSGLLELRTIFQAFTDIQFYVTFRMLRQLLPSNWQQSLKSGANMWLDSYIRSFLEFPPSMQPWRPDLYVVQLVKSISMAFPGSSMTIVNMSSRDTSLTNFFGSVFPQSGLVEKLIEISSSFENENQSLSLNQCEKLIELNASSKCLADFKANLELAKRLPYEASNRPSMSSDMLRKAELIDMQSLRELSSLSMVSMIGF